MQKDKDRNNARKIGIDLIETSEELKTQTMKPAVRFRVSQADLNKTYGGVSSRT